MTDASLVTRMQTMLQMQDEMNRRVDADWLERKREWYRAIWIECAELMDHYGGWKWWKHSTPDVDQVLLEIVDIWHFGLSMRIDAGRDYAAAASRLAEEWSAPSPSRGFLRDVETLAESALARQEFAVDVIPTLLAGIDRDFIDLYRGYVGKNVLNFFRQDHGYKDGTYRKVWAGREDNEHLVEVIVEVDVNTADYRGAVYQALTMRYRETG